MDKHNYIAHISFIVSKAALNLYATDALIKYEEAVTERVLSCRYKDWSIADPECVALHLGADATYAVRQSGSRWVWQSSASFGPQRDFADWPKDVCWLYNNTSCYFQRCKKSHICCKCKRRGHTMRECKIKMTSLPRPAPITSRRSLRKRLVRREVSKMATTVRDLR